MADKMEKVMNLIRKLMEVTTENGATENEAIEASLKAQRLMTKYDIEFSQLEDNAEAIVETEVKTSNDVWRVDLANIIANNFCCKVFGKGNGKHKGTTVVFYGYKRHCEVASAVFSSIYEFGRGRAKLIYKEYSNMGYDPKGIKNQFYIGFLHGVKSALDAQSRQLMIVTPPEVENAYTEKMTGAKRIVRRINYHANREIYDRGYNAGREVATQKAIEN